MPSTRKRRTARVETRVVRARYDAAQTTNENRRLWSAADNLSADGANSPFARTILRNRCRYVFANNPRAKGMKDTLANHTVGRGPALQLYTGDRAVASEIEAAFSAWAREVRLGLKLRTLRKARAESGEAFCYWTVNPKLRSPVKLDLQIIESDFVCDPTSWLNPQAANHDGVFVDSYDNPIAYRVLRHHPGDPRIIAGSTDYTDVSATQVDHYYLPDRPHQHRGVPDITPAVQLIEEGRRFRSAVLAASETAADYAMAIETDQPADGDLPEPMDTFELSRRLVTVLPNGYKLAQTKAEQPTTNYKDFTRSLLGEVAHCLQMPLSVAAMDSSESNMSAAYVDLMTYGMAIDTERAELETILDSGLAKWLTFAADPGVALVRTSPEDWGHQWFWPALPEHADQSKTAAAKTMLLASGLTSIPAEYDKAGKDWEQEQEAAARSLGLSLEEYRRSLAASIFAAGANLLATPPTPETGNVPPLVDGQARAHRLAGRNGQPRPKRGSQAPDV